MAPPNMMHARSADVRMIQSSALVPYVVSANLAPQDARYVVAGGSRLRLSLNVRKVFRKDFIDLGVDAGA